MLSKYVGKPREQKRNILNSYPSPVTRDISKKKKKTLDSAAPSLPSSTFEFDFSSKKGGWRKEKPRDPNTKFLKSFPPFFLFSTKMGESGCVEGLTFGGRFRPNERSFCISHHDTKQQLLLLVGGNEGMDGEGRKKIQFRIESFSFLFLTEWRRGRGVALSSRIQ